MPVRCKTEGDKPMTLEKAIQRCIDRCNLEGEDVDIYKFMYQYKAIRNLPKNEFEAVYDRISETLGFNW